MRASGRRRIAGGRCPIAQNSGKLRGQRSLRGGRVTVRRMLYLAALNASRHADTFRAFRTRLTAAA